MWITLAAGVVDNTDGFVRIGGTLGIITTVGIATWKMFVAYQASVTGALRDQVKSEADARQLCQQELEEERARVAAVIADARTREQAHWTEVTTLRNQLFAAQWELSTLRRQHPEEGT